MHDEGPRRVVDNNLMGTLRVLEDLGLVGGLFDPLDQLVEFLVLPVRPVPTLGRRVAGQEVECESARCPSTAAG